jgi:hypothetical protein
LEYYQDPIAVGEVFQMKGPHDHEIQGPDAGEDKARKRLEEFVSHRFPEGVPPASSPTDEPKKTAEPIERGKKKKKGKNH